MTTDKLRRSETWSPIFGACGKDGELYSMDDLKRRGRPLKPDAKRKRICVRVAATDVHKLNFLIEERGMTPTEIFEQGLKMTYNLKKSI